MDAQTFIAQSTPFLIWLTNWEAGIKPIPFAEAIPHPERTAVLCVDLIVGFAYEGPLSSPRVAGIVPPIARLFQSGPDGQTVVWVGEAMMSTDRADLRHTVDYLLIGCIEYLGVDTGRKVTMLIKNDDPRIMSLADD